MLSLSARERLGKAERLEGKNESPRSRAALCEDAHSLEDREPADLALGTDDRDDRSGN